MDKSLRVVVAVGAFLVGSYVARRGFDWLRREPPVSSAVVESRWVAQTIGSSGYQIDVPWPLESSALPLPPEIANTLVSSVALAHEGDGLHIMAMGITLPEGREPSLEGAADGSIANLRNVPGTASVNGGKVPAMVLDRPAFDLEARIERSRGAALQLYGLVFVDGPRLVQIQFIAAADQPKAKAAWARLRSSLRRAA